MITPVVSTANDDENPNSSSINFMASNKPIRILRRPTNQSQPSTNNDASKVSSTNASVTSSATNNTNNIGNSTWPSSVNTSSSTTVPVVSIIPRSQNKDSANNSQSINTSSSSQTTKPPIKTYEQREQEYRLARLR